MTGMTMEYVTKGGDKVKIEYMENSNTWRAELEDEYTTASSLMDLKTKLDKKTSPRAKSRRIPCLVNSGYGTTLVPAHATSMDDSGYQVRITFDKGSKREQVPSTRLYVNNEKNRELAEQIHKLTEERHKIDNAVRDLFTKLDKFDKNQLKDE